jgi:hypothetical protein
MINLISRRYQIIAVINNPLAFFALALLIVESFIATVLIYSDLKTEDKYIGMWVGIVLFFLVVTIVGFCVWFKPQHLVYNQYGHLMDSEIINVKEKDQARQRNLNKLPKKRIKQ